MSSIDSKKSSKASSVVWRAYSPFPLHHHGTILRLSERYRLTHVPPELRPEREVTIIILEIYERKNEETP